MVSMITRRKPPKLWVGILLLSKVPELVPLNCRKSPFYAGKTIHLEKIFSSGKKGIVG